MNEKIKKFILDILFPKFCVNCKTEGSYLCPDCFSLIEILDRQYCPFCQIPIVVSDGKTCSRCARTHNLNGLYCVTSYKNLIIKKLIHSFKYKPFVKDISEILAFLIINHLSLIAQERLAPQLSMRTLFLDSILIPVPLSKKKLKFRGFNPAEEIAKHLSKYLKIPLLNNVLIKTKETLPQMELKKEERMKNIKGAFSCSRFGFEQIKNREILLVDDVFTTGSTMEECAAVLKKAGAKKVWGVVVARG